MNDIFRGIDYHASISIKGQTMTIALHFADAEQCEELAKTLIASHARGEPVTLTLANPGFFPNPGTEH
jgi:hypothetical protein